MEKNNLISHRKILLIGGSAGSLEVLMKILPQLAPTITYTIVLVLHRKSAEDSTLEELIALKTFLPVKEVEDKVVLESGAIYVAPADYHLLFEKNGLLSLDVSEKINYSRPSIDVAFESAALAYGEDVTAIILSGANADGTEGLKFIQKAGGKTIVQDPETASVPFMPRHALENASPNYIMNIEKMINFLTLEKTD